MWTMKVHKIRPFHYAIMCITRGLIFCGRYFKIFFLLTHLGIHMMWQDVISIFSNYLYFVTWDRWSACRAVSFLPDSQSLNWVWNSHIWVSSTKGFQTVTCASSYKYYLDQQVLVILLSFAPLIQRVSYNNVLLK